MPLGSGELLALTGMMGAGKSTVARLLAARLGRQVVSTDAMLEARFGKPVARIFAEDGEPAFRAAERAIIDRLDGGLVVDLVTREPVQARYERSDVCAVPAAAVVVEAVVAWELAAALVEKFGGDCVVDVEKAIEAYAARIR